MSRIRKIIATGMLTTVAVAVPAASAMAATSARSAASSIGTGLTSPPLSTPNPAATGGETGTGASTGGGSGDGKPKPLTCEQAITKANVHITVATFYGILGMSAASAAESGKAQGLVEGACGVAA